MIFVLTLIVCLFVARLVIPLSLQLHLTHLPPSPSECVTSFTSQP